MNNRKNQQLIIDFIIKPVILGLFVAAMLMFAIPQLRVSMNTADDSLIVSSKPTLDKNWMGAVSYASAAAQAAPSVVNIYTEKKALSSNVSASRNSLGSGVIMQSNGLILTNHHVIDGALSILVLLHDGRQAPATIVGIDTEIDLAVLKIALPNLEPITVGNPSQARIGDVVLAIGNPSGIGQSVTQGIVSAKGRNGLRLNNFENFIQTDADISAGSSGGALVDVYGNLLGINTATLNGSGASGISFAIPADAAVKVLNDIVRFGRTVRGWLGVNADFFEASKEAYATFGFEKAFVITDLTPDGPASKSGLMVNDIILKIDGIAVTDPNKSIAQITNVRPGQSLKLDVLRIEEVIRFTVIAGDRTLKQ